MNEDLKDYIIVGDNNFWYSLSKQVTKKQLLTDVEYIQNQIAEYGFDENIETQPTELIVYEVTNELKFKVPPNEH